MQTNTTNVHVSAGFPKAVTQEELTALTGTFLGPVK